MSGWAHFTVCGIEKNLQALVDYAKVIIAFNLFLLYLINKLKLNNQTHESENFTCYAAIIKEKNVQLMSLLWLSVP